MLPDSVKRLVVNTGNLISYKEFKKKATQSPSEEVYDSVLNTLNAQLSASPAAALDDSDVFVCIGKTQMKVDQNERNNLKVTVKIFLENFLCEDLKSCVFQAMEQLGITVIDSLILSLSRPPSEEKLKLDNIKPLWTTLEKLVEDSAVLSIGISDLDTEELSELYNWSQVKPSVNQVNLESCCVMPPEMTAFAQEHDIQLLTHNDPKVLLSKENLQKIFEPTPTSSDSWRVDWIVRYSVLIKSRGIIQNKGYLLSATKKKH